MKQMSRFSVAAIVACLMIANWGMAEDKEQIIKVKFSEPFTLLRLPSVWQVEDNEKNEVEFEHSDNDDITFSLVAGKAIKKGASLDKLQKQIISFTQKKSKLIPLFLQSFGYLEFDPQEIAEAQDNIDPKMERICIGSKEWLKIHVRGENEITMNLSLMESTFKTPIQEVFYATFINNRLHLASFSAPKDLFDTYAPLFETTMQMICP